MVENMVYLACLPPEGRGIVNMAQPYWVNKHILSNIEKPAEKKGSYTVLFCMMFLWSLTIIWAILKTLVIELVRFLQLYNYIKDGDIQDI